jgi:hypothetical protein
MNEDHRCIRDIIESWVVWRDSGQWERLSPLWHDDGVMSSTWQQSGATAFVEASKAAWARGIDVQHFLGGSAIDVQADRAIAQTKMSISQRAPVQGILVDVTCLGRFYDFLERRDGRWGIIMRQPIYERDRIDPVDPTALLVLEEELLAQFPQGYRHLAYLQTKAGMTVKRDMPGRTGQEVQALYERGKAWLSGVPGHPASEGFGNP